MEFLIASAATFLSVCYTEFYLKKTHFSLMILAWYFIFFTLVYK